MLIFGFSYLLTNKELAQCINNSNQPLQTITIFILLFSSITLIFFKNNINTCNISLSVCYCVSPSVFIFFAFSASCHLSCLLSCLLNLACLASCLYRKHEMLVSFMSLLKFKLLVSIVAKFREVMLTHGYCHDFVLSISICEEVKKIYRNHSYGQNYYHIVLLFQFILRNIPIG